MRLNNKIIWLFVSGGLILSIVYLPGLNDFLRLWEHLKWEYLLPFLVMVLLTIMLLGYRWWLILDKVIPFWKDQAISVISLGGNMVLPARGGDLLKAYQTHRLSTTKGHMVLARLLLEKIVDLGIIILLGCSAFLIIGVNDGNIVYIWLSLDTIFCLLIFLGMLRFRHRLVMRLIRKSFNILRLRLVYERYIEHFLHEIYQALKNKSLIKPLLLTLFLWLVVYSLTYQICAVMVGLSLTFPETYILLMAGAMGLAIPAVPSGLGTFHIAITSGCLLLGKSFSEGILLGLVIHACNFVGFLSLAGVAYVMTDFRHPSIDRKALTCNSSHKLGDS